MGPVLGFLARAEDFSAVASVGLAALRHGTLVPNRIETASSIEAGGLLTTGPPGSPRSHFRQVDVEKQ